MWEGLILPRLDAYWTERYNVRKDRSIKSSFACAYNDLFRLSIVTNDKDGRPLPKGEMRMLCTLPNHQDHWDAILSMYLILFPDLFPNTWALANSLLNAIFNVGMDPDHYINFPPEAGKMLHKMATMGFQLQTFSEDIINVSGSMECLTKHELLHGHPDYDLEKMKEGVKEIVLKDLDKMDPENFRNFLKIVAPKPAVY